MNKTVVSWQYKNKIEQNMIGKLEFFAEMVEATFDISHSEDGMEEKVEINIFFEADEFFNKEITQEELAKITGDEIELLPIYEQDWQAESIQSFKPIQIGRFYIHSFDEQAPAEKVSLKIPAKMAFGTGEHATTKGCLALYDQISKDNTFKNGLDMGCGSAILSMAANKADNVKFLGVDIDLLSVDIAHENIAVNDIKDDLKVIYGDGFNDPAVTQNGEYDIIFANILKNPLLEMSQDLVDTLQTGGYAILSGFKEVDQKEEIINKYVQELGLTPIAEFNEDSWSAICLKK